MQNWLDPINSSTKLSDLRLIRGVTINASSTVSGDIVKFQNVTVEQSKDITINIKEKFEVTGTFRVSIGSSLLVRKP